MSTSPTRGSTSVQDPEEHRRKRGFPLWLAALLALLLLGLVLFLLLRGGDDDVPDAGAAATSAAAAGSDAAGDAAAAASRAAGAAPSGAGAPPAGALTTAPGGAPATGGTLTADGRPILPLPAGGLAPYAGRPAEARAARVESVVSDEGFWVGSGPQDRVFAFLAIPGESAPQIAPGQPVTFTGTVRPLPADPATAFALSPEDGLDQLVQQGHYVEVTAVEQVQ